MSLSPYAEKTAKIVPGLRDLHRMAGVLLAERVPPDARILVLGAGGGLELKAFGEMQPGWHFDGVDPSSEMLALARTTLGSMAPRVRLHEGYIDCAPAGPFDGATCLLTLHFLSQAERLKTLQEYDCDLSPELPWSSRITAFQAKTPLGASGLRVTQRSQLRQAYLWFKLTTASRR